MDYYQNGSNNNAAVTAAYAGKYSSIAEAGDAEDIKDKLFASGHEGYLADYSNGVYFTIFVGADGTENQEIYHYCIRTKAGIVSSKNSGADVTFTGLADASGGSVTCYPIKTKDDSYGDKKGQNTYH